ncbi:MAG: hypothetical protein P4L56_10535 [Candidatus Sulfopaludibacter sp.]|nr:hypothetical protein [Candidatus Sulfopaludibacter sp.]
MASRLNGLQRTLTWQDFGSPRPGNPPAAGQRATAAQTRARPNRTIFAEPVPGTRPPQFRLRDDAVIAVELDRAQTFVNQWALNRPAPFPTDLLHHEQGHYDLVALFCRDMFIELMMLKEQSSSTPQAGMKAAQAIFQRFDGFIAAVHTPYDTQTDHGNIAQQQQRWDGFIRSAFTTPRTPPMSAPDGTSYKVALLDVLRQGGVSL